MGPVATAHLMDSKPTDIAISSTICRERVGEVKLVLFQLRPGPLWQGPLQGLRATRLGVAKDMQYSQIQAPARSRGRQQSTN